MKKKVNRKKGVRAFIILTNDTKYTQDERTIMKEEHKKN